MSNSKAYMSCGEAEALKPANAFDFLFSNPFHHESPYVPTSRTVPRISGSQHIFVDEASGRFLPYCQLKEDALTIAHNLLALPLNPNNVTPVPPTPTCPSNPHIPPVVLIQLPNCLPFVPLVLGALAAHLSVTLVSPFFTAKEISWVLEHTRPALVVTSTRCVPAMTNALERQKGQGWSQSVKTLVVDLDKDVYPVSLQHPDASDWKILLTVRKALAKRLVEVKPYDPRERAAMILWSSGTSGRSKGVLLSHHALNFCVSSLWHDADFYNQDEQQRWLGFIPFFHIFGISNILLLAIASGSTVYIQPRFTPSTFMEAVKRRRITYLALAPPVAVFLAKSPAMDPYLVKDSNGNHAFSSVTGGVSGGAPLGFDTIQQAYNRVGFRVRRGYGLTEGSGGVTLQKELAMGKLYDKDGDLGKSHWGVQVMIAGPKASNGSKTAEAAPLGATGEILVKSPGLLMSYLPHPSDTSSVEQSPTFEALTKDGWFRTGDIGRITSHSRLIYEDRVKEIIKVKGYQVVPAELESVLTSDDSVADAGVVARRDKAEETELPRAYVSLTEKGKKEAGDDVGSLASRLRRLVETQTAGYKWLKGGMVFVEAIPRSPSGKILRRVLKDGVPGREVDLYAKRKERL